MGTPVMLREMGYVSIGWAPAGARCCGGRGREGRWWWDCGAMKECGQSGDVSAVDKVRSIHWFPYDRVRVVNAVP